MIFTLAMAAAAAAQTPVGRDIHRLCREDAPCIARQQLAARRFLGLMVAFDAPQVDGEHCLRAGKTAAGLVDWPIAEQCLRSWSKGRKSILPGR